ncbi:unnamed protein product [Adineta steineri]|uniref:26S proteasome non-ATPase regulatory subunit 7 n=1 Tax=Adineta steineri TaxID=433720 RepID=A0A818R5B6_9BILA|nr:unnamed protein product [Adineta steineri]CAF3644837.1 unnamed protein product [Adineta steineri]
MPPPAATTTSAKPIGDEQIPNENGLSTDKNLSLSISPLNKIEKVVVHPLVLLSVVDHFNRMGKIGNSQRVVGVLLGSLKNKILDVSNSFALPFDEEDKEKEVWFLDHEYLENMYTMFRKVNARERIVGWYHTGPKLHRNDISINELIREYHPDSVLVIIDAKPKDLGLPTEAYIAVEEIHDDGSPASKTFEHLPSEIGAEEAEEVGVEHLLRDIRNATVGTLSQRITNQLMGLKGLTKSLYDVRAYLDKLLANKLPLNHQILSHIQDMFNLLPDVTQYDLIKSIYVKTNDEMLLVYLSSLIRSIIALHNLIMNKIQNSDAEKTDNIPATTTTANTTAASGDKKVEKGSGDKDNRMQLRILTLNIWGVRYLAKLIDERLQALVTHLINPEANYDIIGLQEVWSKTDYLYIRDHIKNIYPHSYYFLSGLFGSGCCMFSKHPIIGVYEHLYTLNGFPHKIQHGDYFAGKLIGLCKILINNHVINVYNTHLHANYHHVVPKDIYLGHRICQAYELIQFIESTSSADTTHLTILLGDLNLTTNDLGFQLIQGILQFHDCFLDRINKDIFDPTVGNNGFTCDIPGNPYVSPHPHHGEGERIDYILYRGRNDNVKCLEAYPTLHKVPNNLKGLHYSDHLAIYALLEINDEIPENKKIKPLENIEITDERTRTLLSDACIIVEETIQRIQRQRMFCTFGVFILVFILFSINGNPLSNSYLYTIFTIIKNLFCLIGIAVSIWFICLGKPVERNALSSIQNAMRIRLQAPHFTY